MLTESAMPARRIVERSTPQSTSFRGDWNPEDFIKIHKSKGVRQLREIIDNIKQSDEVTNEKLESYLNDARNLAESLSPGRNFTYAIAGFGGQAISTLGLVGLPLFWLPSYLFTAILGVQVFNAFQQISKADKLKWIEVANTVAGWAQSQQSKVD